MGATDTPGSELERKAPRGGCGERPRAAEKKMRSMFGPSTYSGCLITTMTQVKSWLGLSKKRSGHEVTRRHTNKSGSARFQVIQGSALHPRLRGWLRGRWPSRLPGAGCATAREGMTAVGSRPLRVPSCPPTGRIRVPSRQSFRRMFPAANPRAKRRLLPIRVPAKAGSLTRGRRCPKVSRRHGVSRKSVKSPKRLNR